MGSSTVFTAQPATWAAMLSALLPVDWSIRSTMAAANIPRLKHTQMRR